MYLSRVDLYYQDLSVAMLNKLHGGYGYVLHQWLWQLFTDQPQRNFLFRYEKMPDSVRCYLLSATPPGEHNLFQIASKPFSPQLACGDQLYFSLCANPVVTRQGKRSDVLMDVKYQAKQALRKGESLHLGELWQRQQQAAIDWLIRQSDGKGFTVAAHQVTADWYQQHMLYKPDRKGKSATGAPASTEQQAELPFTAGRLISFGSIDLQGVLTVQEPDRFIAALASGFGKSKSMGCGLMLVKRI